MLSYKITVYIFRKKFCRIRFKFENYFTSKDLTKKELKELIDRLNEIYNKMLDIDDGKEKYTLNKILE